MGNFFDDAFDVIKDPTSWNPIGLVTNTTLKATGNKTIGEGIVDFVVTGCGTGSGAMLACNSFLMYFVD